MPLPDACLVAITTAVVERERAAADKLREALSSFFSQVPLVFLCIYHWAGERIQEGEGE